MRSHWLLLSFRNNALLHIHCSLSFGHGRRERILVFFLHPSRTEHKYYKSLLVWQNSFLRNFFLLYHKIERTEQKKFYPEAFVTYILSIHIAKRSAKPSNEINVCVNVVGNEEWNELNDIIILCRHDFFFIWSLSQLMWPNQKERKKKNQNKKDIWSDTASDRVHNLELANMLYFYLFSIVVCAVGYGSAQGECQN